MKFLLTQTHMGLEISKCYSSYSFYPMWAKIMINTAAIVEYKVMDILVICQKIKTFVAL